jgi:hypothetical protein
VTLRSFPALGIDVLRVLLHGSPLLPLVWSYDDATEALRRGPLDFPPFSETTPGTE